MLTTSADMSKTPPSVNYRTRIVSSLPEIGQASWDALVAIQSNANPFLSYAFLDSLHESGCASAESGWQPQYLTIWRQQDGDELLAAALPLYAKAHSYGEYVFDWAWADAYQRNGLPYYPKLLSAIPFTPVTGSRLLALDAEALHALVAAIVAIQKSNSFSSTHILYPPQAEAETLRAAGFMLRTGVQFHWLNAGYHSFDDFLATLERKKRKNIRAERRKVQQAGIRFRHIRGQDATEQDWIFFKRCYDRTYTMHRSTPYLNLDFFLSIAATMPQHLLLIVAIRDEQALACSLVVYDQRTLYGRYWGTMEEIDSLHFETAYYQPLEFCIAEGIQCFEGGAQGEHKMARGFLPQKTWSAHWLAHAAFADAVEHFLQQESSGIAAYIDELNEHNPFQTGLKKQDAKLIQSDHEKP